MLSPLTVETIKQNLPITEKGNMSELQFNRAKDRVRLLIIVDYFITQKQPIPSWCSEIRFVKEYLQQRHSDYIPAVPTPMEKIAQIVWQDWRRHLILFGR